MTQNELNRAVAAATGETVKTIAEIGFIPLNPTPVQREPLVVDWDRADDERVSVFPQRRRRKPVPA